MELYQLRTFVAVAETQSVTRAAERLYTTPPSVSAHIKALEAELGLTLFHRTPRGMALTPHGELLKQQATTALEAADALIHRAAKLHHALVGRLRVGVNSAPARLGLPPVLNALQASHPDLQVTLVPSVSGRIAAQLQQGALDAGFLFGPPPAEGVIAAPLADVELVVATPATWEPLVCQERWEEMAALPWIASTVDCPFETLSDALFARRGLAVRKAVVTDDSVTKIDLVRAGVGAALVERADAEAAGEGVVLWAPQPITCTLALAWPAQKTEDPCLAAFRRQVVDFWQTQPRPAHLGMD